MDALEAARRASGDFLELLGELVATDSGTYTKAGVDAVGERLAGLLGQAGCRIERHRLERYGDCFQAELPGEGEGELLLLGHTDTVYPEGTAAERPLRVEGDRALGPGAADMKGGLLLGLCALRALARAPSRSFRRVTFFVNSEEEVGSPVSRSLYARCARRAHVGLVLEPGRPGGEVVSARHGVASLELSVRGRPAHAGVNPEEGASAVHALVALLRELHERGAALAGARLNVGVIEGGTRSNVVAERARAAIDVRVEDHAAWERAEALVAEIASQRPLPGVTVELSGGLNNPPMPLTPAGQRLVALAVEEARGLGFELQHVSSGGGSDANFVASLGTPCLDGLGPCGGLLHGPEEYLLLPSVVPRLALLIALLTRLPGELQTLRAPAPDSG